MKSNTKLIMENWRKFLSEGPMGEDEFADPMGMRDDMGGEQLTMSDTGLDEDGLPEEPEDLVSMPPEDLPPPSDDDLMGDMGSDPSMPRHDDYNPEGFDDPEGFDADEEGLEFQSRYQQDPDELEYDLDM